MMKQSVATAAESPLPGWQLGQMQLDAGQPQEALKTLEIARDKLDSMPIFHITMMRAHIDAKNPEKAIEIAGLQQL